MDINHIFSMYDPRPPESYDFFDTSRGKDDFRQVYLVAWKDKKLAVKIASNDFTTSERVIAWQNTIRAYRSLGFYSPQIVPNRNRSLSERVLFDNKKCIVYAEEYSKFKTAEQHGVKRFDHGKKYPYHESAIRFLATIGFANLKTADFPSGICLFDTFSPSDPCDEILETALEFKHLILSRYPVYEYRFSQIWERFLENKEKLSKVYPQLPRSVFQADLNPANILLNDSLEFVGVLDYNLCGKDTVINCIFREAFTDFYEDVPWDKEKNVFYDREVNEKALSSFLLNLDLMARYYPFSEIEQDAAILLYRYLRPFWWQPLLALQQAQTIEQVDQILSWIEKEQVRDIDFKTIMT